MSQKDEIKKILTTFTLDFCQFLMRTERDFNDIRISEIREFCDQWVEQNIKVKELKK